MNHGYAHGNAHGCAHQFMTEAKHMLLWILYTQIRVGLNPIQNPKHLLINREVDESDNCGTDLYALIGAESDENNEIHIKEYAHQLTIERNYLRSGILYTHNLNTLYSQPGYSILTT
jgi:hypothetical protein